MTYWDQIYCSVSSPHTETPLLATVEGRGGCVVRRWCGLTTSVPHSEPHYLKSSKLSYREEKNWRTKKLLDAWKNDQERPSVKRIKKERRMCKWCHVTCVTRTWAFLKLEKRDFGYCFCKSNTSWLHMSEIVNYQSYKFFLWNHSNTIHFWCVSSNLKYRNTWFGFKTEIESWVMFVQTYKQHV